MLLTQLHDGKTFPSTATLTKRKFFDFSLTVITLELFYIHQTSTPIPIPLVRWLILSFLMGMRRDAKSIFVSFIRSLKCHLNCRMKMKKKLR